MPLQFPEPGAAIAPVTEFLLAEVKDTIDATLEPFGSADPTANAVIGSMLHLIASLDDRDSLAAGVFAPGAKVAYYNLIYEKNRAFTAAQGEAPVNAPGEDGDEVGPARAPVSADNVLGSMIIRNSANCSKWIHDLVNANKKQTLKKQTVASYFAAIGLDGITAGPIAGFVNRLSRFFPDNISVAAFRGALTPGTWTTYRSTRVSSGLIIHKLTRMFTELGIFKAGDAEIVEASAKAPWDVALANEIPGRLKAYASIYLAASGRPLDDWYQGNKAVDEMDNPRINAAKIIFKKYNILRAEHGDIEDAASVEDLRAQTEGFF